MFEWLVYTGGLADVEVSFDEPVGGWIVAERGKPAKFPKVIADGLLQHGENSDPDGASDRQWRKATSKEIAAAEKTNEAVPAEAAAGEGDQS